MRLALTIWPGLDLWDVPALVGQRCHVPVISPGDVLKDNINSGTDLGRQAKEHIDVGGIIPDEVIVGMIGERVAEPDAASGFLLSNFPRTIGQAHELDALLAEAGNQLDLMVVVQQDDEQIISRLARRRLCESCALILVLDPTTIAERCDNCGGKLYQRPDDHPDVVEARLKHLHEQINPILDRYAPDRLAQIRPEVASLEAQEQIAYQIGTYIDTVRARTTRRRGERKV
jgi:adenylate kinase